MEVILLEKDINLGNLGDIVRVRDGYARNYLIPQKKARRATPDALKEFADRRAELEKMQAEKLAAAQALAARLSGFQLKVQQKAGVDSRLFGSVTNADIAEGLQKANFGAIAKAQIRLLNGAIKTLGEFPVQVILHADVITDITVQVEGDLS